MKDRIRTERIDLLYRHSPLALLINLLIASLLVGSLWPYLPRQQVIGWTLVFLLVFCWRLALFFLYLRRNKDKAFPWATAMTLTTLVSGLVWGSAGVLFYQPDIAEVMILLTILLAGMTAGSIVAHGSWPPAQVAYALPILLPIGSLYLLTGDAIKVALGIASLIYVAAMISFAYLLNNSLVSSLRLRLEKEQLADQLQVEMQKAREAQQRAEEASRAKTQFLASASHDLRQPLHSIGLFVEALRQEPNTRQTGQVVDHLGVAATALEGLLNELLDISKLEAGLYKPNPQRVALSSLFHSLESELRPVAEAKGLELGFVTTRIEVESDPQMLGRILRNLIINAIHHTRQGALLVGCRRKPGAVRICVVDTGPGIAAEHHEKIFQEFFQLNNPERDRSKGLGLGLAIVRGLCRILKHPLGLESVPGKGSCFHLLVPLASSTSLLPVPQDTPQAPGLLVGSRVLVIDDDAEIGFAMQEVLKHWGCQALIAESAADTLSKLATTGFQPQVIVADYRLRNDLTGRQAIEAVRHALQNDLPALILTGDTAPERLKEASINGFALLHKPLQPDKLYATLCNLLNKGDHP